MIAGFSLRAPGWGGRGERGRAFRLRSALEAQTAEEGQGGLASGLVILKSDWKQEDNAGKLGGKSRGNEVGGN
jgi:hypothetical protein